MTPTTFVSIRVPNALCAEVRAIAEREGETQSSIIRRLVRHGLVAERLFTGRDEAPR